jgi:HD-GYP domain-containing protein (c-di-GMP phosphodiesterase class II)
MGRQTMPVRSLVSTSKTLTERLRALHETLLESFPCVDRIAFALYDPRADLLRSFVDSTRGGAPLKSYSYRLSDCVSLLELARSGELRVVDDLPATTSPDTAHSARILAEGFRSSFTVPVKDDVEFYGFMFFDSRHAAAFTAEVQRGLVLRCGLIGMLVSKEIVATRTLLKSTRIALEVAGARDFETGLHLDRVAAYSEIIARKVAPVYGFDDEHVEMLRLFAPLHDIGKVGIPDDILLKHGPLLPNERRIMETHVEVGLKIVDRSLSSLGDQQMPREHILRNIIWCHHEFLDGSGYPRGLRGDDVPLEARVVTAADVFDALTAYRHYKAQWPNEQAFDELRTMADSGKIDRPCVDALLDSVTDIKSVQSHCGERAT